MPIVPFRIMLAVWDACSVERAGADGGRGNQIMSKVTGIALGKNKDGHLELLATSVDEGSWDTAWHAWQTASDDWTGWHSFGKPGRGAPSGALSVISHAADGRLEVFLTAGDQTVWHRWQIQPNGGWSEWSSLGKPGGQPATTTPAVTLAPDSRVVAFVIAGGTIWQASQQQPGIAPHWSAWSSLGRPSGGTPNALAAATNAEGYLELFARVGSQPGAPGTLWHCRQTAPDSDHWTNWSPLTIPEGQHASGVPVVVQSADGRLELFTTTEDRAVWTHSQRAASDSNSSVPWVRLGSPPGGVVDLGAVLDAGGSVAVVATSHNGTDLWYMAEAPGIPVWPGEWLPLGSVTPGPVQGLTLKLDKKGRTELFLRTPSTGGLYQISQTEPGKWRPYLGRPWPHP
jgi:hypothetical protein